MGLIAEETIARVADASDIVDVIGSYFKLTRAGSAYKALCPFHQEKTPSFTVSPQRQSYHCFGCGAGGGVIRFVMEYEHVDFPTAVRRLAERAGIPVIEEACGDEDGRAHSQRARLLALHQWAAAWFASNLLRARDAEAARAYLYARGLGSEVAKSWKLGWAPDTWDALKNRALGEGFSEQELLTAGLVTRRDGEDGSGATYDRFRGRVMFPICNDLGEVLAFSGRTLEACPKSAKYVNSPETPIFTKGRVLFGLDHSKRSLLAARQAIVCEGQIDVIRVFESGFQNVLAPLGTAFTPQQAALLKRYVESVVLCFDADAAGLAAAERSHGALARADLDVRVVVLPPGEDPDSLIRKSGADAFRKLLNQAEDFYSFLIERSRTEETSNSARSRARLAARMAPALSMISDPILLDSTLASVASRIGVGIPELRRLVAASHQAAGREEIRQSRHNQPEPSAERLATGPLPALHPALAQILLIGLRDEASRQWLQRQKIPAYAKELVGLSLLEKLAALACPPEGTSLSAYFLATLPPDEQAMLTAVQHGGLPDNPEALLDCWTAMLKAACRLRMDALKARLADPATPRERVKEIQKEILDTQRQLADTIALSAADGGRY